jgi:hypothetical protein
MAFTQVHDFACPNSLKLWRATLFVATCARLLLCNLDWHNEASTRWGIRTGVAFLQLSYCNVIKQQLLVHRSCSRAFRCVALLNARQPRMKHGKPKYGPRKQCSAGDWL